MTPAKRWLKRSLSASGLLQMATRLAAPAVAILAYHSVNDHPEELADTLGGIVHPTAGFRQQMELLAREFHPVSLNDVLLFVQGKKKLPAKPVAVTFDDGYADNFQVVSPVLKAFDIPASFYLIVDCVDRATLPWVARLRLAFSRTQIGRWTDPTGWSWSLTAITGRYGALQAAFDYCARLRAGMQQEFVEATARQLEVDWPAQSNLMMTWEQARKLVKQGHTLGSHTMTHPNVSYLAVEDLRFELAQSKRRMEKELGASVVHFSYPCPALQPHWNQQTLELCRTLGYDTAVTSRSGPVRTGDNALSLRRVPPTTDVDGLRWNLECTFLGRAV